MRKYPIMLAIALAIAAGSAWSIDIGSIGGDYVGKVIDAKGVGAGKGDACHVSINPEAKGNTVEFDVNGKAQAAYIERDEVARALKKGSGMVKLTTTSHKGKKVIVVLKFKGERLHLVREKVIDHATVRWTLACGGLAGS